MNIPHPARRNDQAAIRKAREAHDRVLDLGSVTLVVDMTYLNLEQRRHGLDDVELPDPRGHAGIAKHPHSRDALRDLRAPVQPFPADTVFECHETGGVATWPVQPVYGGDTAP